MYSLTRVLTMNDKIRRFDEIRSEVADLMNEAIELYTAAGGMEARGRSYWFAHVMGALALGSEHNGGSLISMADAREEMVECAYEAPTYPDTPTGAINALFDLAPHLFDGWDPRDCSDEISISRPLLQEGGHARQRPRCGWSVRISLDSGGVWEVITPTHKVHVSLAPEVDYYVVDSL